MGDIHTHRQRRHHGSKMPNVSVDDSSLNFSTIDVASQQQEQQQQLPRGVDPLDFSFKCLCSLNDLKEEVPRPRGDKPLKCKEIVEYVTREENDMNINDDEQDVHEDGEEDERRFSFGRARKSVAEEKEKVTRYIYIATAIRLNNNTISDLSCLQPIMSSIMVNWRWLAWIDLSFNDISVLDISFGSFPELRLIYLHGNAIEKITEIEKLKSVQHLHTLTLHG